jgi:hypothetical protein
MNCAPRAANAPCPWDIKESPQHSKWRSQVVKRGSTACAVVLRFSSAAMLLPTWSKPRTSCKQGTTTNVSVSVKLQA